MKTQIPPALLNSILEKMSPQEVWLFGSQARGDAYLDSDWDLMVVLPDSAPDEALDMVQAWQAVSDLRIPADIIPIRKSEFDQDRRLVGTLSRTVFLEGKQVHGA
jgi:uncharacterized protein